MGGHARAAARERQLDVVRAIRVARPNRPVHVHEAGRVEVGACRSAVLTGSDRKRDAVLVDGDGADRGAEPGPLVGLLVKRRRRSDVVVKALVDGDARLDAPNAIGLDLAHHGRGIARREGRVAVSAQNEGPRHGIAFKLAREGGFVAVLAAQNRERRPRRV